MSRGAWLLAGALAAACAHAPGPGRASRVEAEGLAPIDRADPAGTRRRAVADALRAAVEKAVGVRVSTRLRVERSVAVEDSVAARSRGWVRSYEILGEEDRDGFRRARVRAVVEAGPRPDGDERPEPPPGDPKVRVVMTGAGAEDAAAGVRRGLTEKGFAVIDAGEADITVRGAVAAAAQGFAGPWPSSRARVTLQARGKEGKILWTSSREASAVGAGEAAAAAKASETAGLLGGEDLARAVALRLAEE